MHLRFFVMTRIRIVEAWAFPLTLTMLEDEAPCVATNIDTLRTSKFYYIATVKPCFGNCSMTHINNKLWKNNVKT
jgi:hypothetical protein